MNYEPLPGIRAALEMYVSLVQSESLGRGDRHRPGVRRRRAETDERGKRSAGEILSVDFRRLAWIFSAPTNTTTKAMATWSIDVIKRHCMEEKLQNEMREAVRQRADIMWLQNDCIYNAFVRPSLSADTIREIEGRLE